MPETAIKNRRPFGFSNNNSVFEQRQRRLESKRANNSQSRKKGNSNTTDAEAPKYVNNENYYNKKMQEQQQRFGPSASHQQQDEPQPRGRTTSRTSVKSNNSRISKTKPRGERLRVVKAVQKSRSVKPERDMSYHTGRPVMVGGRGQGTGLFAQPRSRRPSTGAELTKKHSNNSNDETVTDELRRELAALNVEHDARAQMVEILMQKIATLEKEVESGKLNKRVIEQQKNQAEDLVDDMRQQTVTTELNNEQLNEQILQLREDLEEERRLNRQKENQLLASARALREAQNEVYKKKQQIVVKDESMKEELNVEKQRNAGLLALIQERDETIVQLKKTNNNLSNKIIPELNEQIEVLEQDFETEKEWRINAQGKVVEEEAQNKKLRKKITALLDQLAREEDHRATAIARAEAATKQMKRIKQENTKDVAIEEEQSKKIKNIKQQVNLRERRLQLMKLQFEKEKEAHKTTSKKKEEVLNAYEGVRLTLKKANAKISMLEKMLYKANQRKAGPVPSILKQKKDAVENDEFSRRDQIKKRLGLNLETSSNNNKNNEDDFPNFEHEPATPQNINDQHTSFDVANSDNNIMKKENYQPIPKDYDASKLPGSDAPEWMKM
eukprot:g3592.t1